MPAHSRRITGARARPADILAGVVGAPPPLRGHSSWHLSRFAIACRASAIVLTLQGYPDHAAHLRRLAAAADTLSRRRSVARVEGLAA